MVWFVVLATTIVAIIIIITVVTLIVVAVINGQNDTTSDSLTPQSNCQPGYISVYDNKNNINTCKASLGVSCNSDSDCVHDLICNGVCSQKNSISSAKRSINIPIGQPKRVTWNKQPSDSAPQICKSVSFSDPQQIIVSSEPTPIVESQIVISPPEPLLSSKKVLTQSCTPLSVDRSMIISVSPSNRKPTQRMIVRSDVNESVTPLTDFYEPINGSREVTSGSREITVVTPKIEASRSIQPFRRIPTDITSIDDEINSDGTRIDGPFDIKSGESTIDDVVGSVSTPCEEKSGIYYCRSNKAETVDTHIDHSPVIDVCSYSNATVFLLKDGHIICQLNNELKQRYRTSNNIPLSRITSFDGYMYGISTNRKLYTLPNRYFSINNWVWNLVEWAPEDVRHISTTHNSSHIWIQTSTYGYLYSEPNVLLFKIPYTLMKRVYGRDVDHYIDINHMNYSAIIHPGGTVVRDVYDGALSYYDEIIAIHPSERNKYHGITIVNWKPYYIQA